MQRIKNFNNNFTYYFLFKYKYLPLSDTISPTNEFI